MAVAKKHRLSLPVTLKKTQRVIVSPFVFEFYDSPSAKVAVVVPKRHVKKACFRNRLKRKCLMSLSNHFLKRENGAILVRVLSACPKDLNVDQKICEGLQKLGV